ncbi:MAG: dienelactone hydrolase family protein [bacterium]|nr:dienelactone hydrolase family protein [bacterium]
MNNFNKIVFIILAITILFAAKSQAAIRTKTIEYYDGPTLLEGYLAFDDSFKGKLPGVIIVHEWTGLGDYAQRRAREVAALGYVAFAADIYGKGIRAANAEEASKLAGIYRADRKLTRSRAQAALDYIVTLKNVDSEKIAVMGYCFGGMVALELARSGAHVLGTVVFHGALDTSSPMDAINIKGKVLVLHGADDPNVPVEVRMAFEKEMRDAGVNWQMNVYGGAVHSFTNPASGNDPKKGVAYNEQADKRSWEEMKMFFKEIFK